MITLTREEAQQVLNDLCGAKLCEINSMSSRAEMLRLIDKTIETLRARLSAPEPEPVAWIYEDDEGRMMFSQMPTSGLFWEPVYREKNNKGIE
jgi:hypothetical protein